MTDRAAGSTANRICGSCGREMQPRRRWAKHWESVRHCSRGCRVRGVSAVDRRLEAAILELLAARAPGASICPSEAARAVSPDDRWSALMEPARRAARRLAHAGRIQITQGGRTVDPADFRGPVRLRHAPRGAAARP